MPGASRLRRNALNAIRLPPKHSDWAVAQRRRERRRSIKRKKEYGKHMEKDSQHVTEIQMAKSISAYRMPIFGEVFFESFILRCAGGDFQSEGQKEKSPARGAL